MAGAAQAAGEDVPVTPAPTGPMLADWRLDLMRLLQDLKRQTNRALDAAQTGADMPEAFWDAWEAMGGVR